MKKPKPKPVADPRKPIGFDPVSGDPIYDREPAPKRDKEDKGKRR